MPVQSLSTEIPLTFEFGSRRREYLPGVRALRRLRLGCTSPMKVSIATKGRRR